MQAVTSFFAGQLDDINQQLTPQADTLVAIEAEQTLFYLRAGHKLISLPVGYRLVAQRFFKHTPPTPDDLEYAINYIEDEIERAIPTIGPISQLVSPTAYLRQIAQLAGVQQGSVMQLPRQEMERLFGYYAEISQGRPPLPSEPDVSPEFYAKLLILREYMHHLKVTSISLLKTE
ncbi:hypothetical protein JYB87_17845 [Shewanella avicenniae]|uniref:Uncharacterized protein n=1 Tax=Shewanella avicenniae TaxID=2814294 RepID=A0ABX7QS64_9GAMM|nr:hypothetical protein [Shewanella avicenniae]QSX33545.1 hypothetical protein JYB87_17845 [Shewanella avicenniae]